MNDLQSINWKRIVKALPKAKMASNDRTPTVDELQKLMEFPDRRIKAIVLTMCSSGIRLGAWDYLKWKHVTPIERGGDGGGTSVVVAAKLIVYADEAEEYYTFITPEAYNALKEWMDFREAHGEHITGQSWIIRNIWRTADVRRSKIDEVGGRYGLAVYPKRLNHLSIKKMLGRALHEQGLRYVLSEGARRHEFKEAHGMRKFFKTRAQKVMSPLNTELLMGHSLGLTDSYYKPQEADVLNDYLKAVSELTIVNNNNTTTTTTTEIEIEKERERKEQTEEFKKLKEQQRNMQETLNYLLEESNREIDAILKSDLSDHDREIFLEIRKKNDKLY